MDDQNEKESGATDGLPLAGVSGSEKRRGRCLCDLCTRIFPMHKRLQEALPEPLRADFEYLMMRLMCAEEDRDVADAKLAGEWPGWEWMKTAREKEEAASPNGAHEPPQTAKKGIE